MSDSTSIDQLAADSAVSYLVNNHPSTLPNSCARAVGTDDIRAPARERRLNETMRCLHTASKSRDSALSRLTGDRNSNALKLELGHVRSIQRGHDNQPIQYVAVIEGRHWRGNGNDWPVLRIRINRWRTFARYLQRCRVFEAINIDVFTERRYLAQ